MDVHEDIQRKTVTATLEVPGLRREDLRIDVRDDGWLTISGETKFSSDTKDEKEYAIRERRYGRFERTIKVPKGVKVSNELVCVSSKGDSTMI